jgi:CHAT domain-containing protein/tetratricopeptide (TPR) repeat protein
MPRHLAFHAMFYSTALRAALLAALVLTPIPVAARSRPREAPRSVSARFLSKQTSVAVPSDLKVGAPVQSRIKGGETQSFTFSLASGQYAAIEIEQHGSELSATLFDPNGRELLQMDYPGGGYGPIYLSHIAAASGDYRLDIRSVNSWAIEKPFDLLLKNVRVAEPADETVVKAQSLFYEAGKSDRANDREAAAELYKQSLGLWQGLRDSHWQALTQFALAGIYDRGSSEDRMKSEVCLRTTLTLLETAPDQKDWRLLASTWNELGVFDGRAGKIAQARIELDEALRIYAAHQDRRGQASALSNLASQDQRLGDLSAAREKVEKALEFRRAENDKPRELNGLNNLAFLYDRLGEPDHALSLLAEILQRWREIPVKDLRPDDHERISAVLNNLAAASDKVGDWDRAGGYYDAALVELGKESPKRAPALDNYGEHYASLGNLPRARDLYEQALVLLPPSSKPNPDIKAGILVHLGQLSIIEGSVPAALEMFQQARDLSPNAPNPPKMVDVLTNLGYAFVLQGNMEKGLAAYNEAWKIQSGLKTEDRRAQALILQKRAQALSLSGRPTEALADLTRALELWKSVKSQRDEASTHYEIASIESKQGKLESAFAHSEQAIAIIESLRENISNRQLRTSYFAKQQDYYGLDVELKMTLSADKKSSEYAGLALETSERSRARILTEVLSEAELRMDCNGTYDDRVAALMNERCSLQNKFAAKSNARMKLLNGPHSAAQIALLDREIDGIVENLEEIEARIRSQNRSFASLTKPQPLTWKQIQGQLDDGTLLLEYSLQDHQSYVWAVTQDSIAGFQLPPRDDIESAAKRIAKALADRNRTVEGETLAQYERRREQADKEFNAASAELSDKIIRPLAPLLGTKCLVIVADGALQLVSFAALPLPGISAEKQRRLIDDYEIVYEPSASVLVLQRSELANRKRAPHAVVILADPVFASDDGRVAALTERHPSSSAPPKSNGNSLPEIATRRKEVSRALEDIGLERFPRLQSSAYEAQKIIDAAPKGEGESKAALSFDASRETAMSSQMSEYRIVHFATHAVVDYEHPELSGIVLSLVDRKGQPQDGYLRLHDIYNLNLPADLIVLSACQTGVGKEVKGEGLIALTRGFMYAGAERVVASLWKVDDAATAELMAQFYKQMFVSGQRPAAALRAAQTTLAKKRSPIDWAGFVLQGEWK